MAVHDLPCRLRAKVTDGDDESYVNMGELPETSKEVRAQWIEEMMRHMQGERSSEAIRPWDFVVALDGSVKCVPDLDAKGESSGLYPANYRIPPSSINSMERPEQIMRQESFALASLIYESWFGEAPHEGLDSEEVQQRYSNARFPEDVKDLPSHLFITVLSNWSVEFANLVLPRLQVPPENPGFSSRLSSYIRSHRYRFAFQVTGGLVGTAAAFTPAVLGAMGFSALGPVAGSAAAGWQGGIGAVQAGSLFAWCQSATMGGTAANGIIATGAAGGGAAALATAGSVMQGKEVDAAKAIDALWEEFKEVYGKGITQTQSRRDELLSVG